MITISPFLYAVGGTPEGYACGLCSAFGCKLWRKYQTFLDRQSLFCCDCAGKQEAVDVSQIDAAGDVPSPDLGGRKHCSIGWLVPAVPTEEGDTFWGYTSIPEGGLRWWRELPTRVPA